MYTNNQAFRVGHERARRVIYANLMFSAAVRSISVIKMQEFLNFLSMQILLTKKKDIEHAHVQSFTRDCERDGCLLAAAVVLDFFILLGERQSENSCTSSRKGKVFPFILRR
jgi:hypothetical protein